MVLVIYKVLFHPVYIGMDKWYGATTRYSSLWARSRVDITTLCKNSSNTHPYKYGENIFCSKNTRLFFIDIQRDILVKISTSIHIRIPLSLKFVLQNLAGI